MSELFIDVTDVEWLKGRQPAPVVGRCPMLGLAQQHSSDLSWALQQRLIRFDGART